MRLVNRAKLPPEPYAVLMGEVPEHHTLLEVVAWGDHQRPPLRVTQVVTQDEFTHDVIIPWRNGLVLVYGAT